MRKEELIACFQDSLQISQGKLRENTIASIKSNKVYKENFVSKVEHKDENAIVSVHAGTTFDVAKKYCQFGKVAVLNFANPEIPGGGVCNGAMAQEECLCRSSNLYACISNENVFGEYYGYHRDFKNYFYSDRLIYTKDVTVFKNDNTVPLLLPEEEWFDVDVITCAAPYVAKRKYTGSTVLLSIFKGRIKNIFEAAKDNQVDVIVLGAFGCGAFKNPPLIVAEAFKQVMCEENYFAEFNQIVFAIKPTSDMCPNLMAFEQQFALPIEGGPETVIESEYVMLDSNITTMLYSNTIKLTIGSSRKAVQFQKDIVNVGRDIESDLVFEDRKTISCKHATFIFENNTWFLRDNHSSNGTWLNGARMNPGKKYQLQANDEINFAMAEKVVFFKQDSAEQPKVDIDKKAIAFLEAGIATFAKSQQKDEVAFKLILSALTDAPLYFPVEIDVTTMFGSVNPENLKPGDTIQPQMDVKMKIRTLTVNDIEIVPMFTSNIEANKGSDTSIVRYYPQDYMPMLLQMDKPIVINPFSEYKFLLPKELISDLLPLLEIKKNSNNVQKIQTGASKDKYIGTTLAERYFVDRLLGEGGFYKTYLVEDKLLMRFLAMKVCDKTNRHYNELVRDMIFQEPHIMAKLKHPAIPLMVDVLEDDESILIFREYVEGVSLETIVKNSGAQPAEKVIEWAKELCDMLRYLHNLTQPHIYRDMKPANVLLMENQHLKVIDFGVVRIYDLMKDRDTCFLGTRGYAAPEQYGGSRQTDVRTDIFGLGMTMHHLVTGVDPKEPSYITKPICQINPSLPKGLEYIISKCIELNPDDRYQNCDELINDLNNYMNLPKSKGILGKLFGRKK